MRPLASTPISRISGISVGQRFLNDSRSLGISSFVSPRSPSRLASKWTCMNMPKKYRKAGKMPAMAICWYGMPRNSIIRNAAAPMMGGVICPPVLLAASTPAAKCLG